MPTAAAYLTALIIVLVLLLGAAWWWYHRPGAWKKFSYKGGDKVAFNSSPRLVSKLRFRNCVFATQNPKGEKVSWDVTAVLNGMAAAYDTNVQITSLPLGGSAQIPLNPFSFKKASFNDLAAVPNAAANAVWAAVPASATTLTGEVRTI